jgi:uncharacterized protein with PIN domain
MNCAICNSNIEETFLGKLKGTIIKKNEQGRNKIFYVCSECQRKEKNLKEKLR